MRTTRNAEFKGQIVASPAACAGLIRLVVLLSLPAFGWAQALNGVQCIADTGVPPTVRVEGITELVGDIVITCTGGTPTPAGTTVPYVNVMVGLNTTITSRLLGSNTGVNDALLLVDEPNTSLNPTPVVACEQNTLLATGKGDTYRSGNCDAFQAFVRNQLQLKWSIPFDPPGSGTRIFRITNIRANVLPLIANGSADVVANWSICEPNGFSIVSPSNLVVATISPSASLAFSATPATATVTGTNVAGSVVLTLNELRPFALKARSGTSNVTNPNGLAPGPGSNAGESGYVVFNPVSPSALPLGAADSGSDVTLEVSAPDPPSASGIVLGVSAAALPVVDTNGTTVGHIQAKAPAGATPGTSLYSYPLGSKGAVAIQFLILDRNLTNTNPAKVSISVLISGSVPQGTAPFTLGARFGLWQTPFGPSGYPATYPAFNTANLDGTPRPFVDIITVNPLGVATHPLGFDTGTAVSNTATDQFTQLPLTVTPNIPPLNWSGQRAALGAHAVSSQAANFALPPTAIVNLVTNALPFGHLTVTKDPAATWLTVNLNGTTTPTWATITVDPNAMVTNPSTTLTFTTTDVPASVGTAKLTVNYKTGVIPWFGSWGFANAASYAANMVAPGEEFIIFGNNFGPAQIAGPLLDANGRAVTILANAQVLFDNVAVPLYYVVDANGNSVITGFAPFELDGKTSTQVQVVFNGTASPPVTLTVVASLPALYTADASGGGQGAILNADGSINSDTRRASPNDVVAIYGNAAGQTVPAGRDGALTGVGAPVAVFKLPVEVFIDGIQATNVPYAGPAPSLVEGIFQINVQIPANVSRNKNVPVVVRIGQQFSQPGVTLAVN